MFRLPTHHNSHHGMILWDRVGTITYQNRSTDLYLVSRGRLWSKKTLTTDSTSSAFTRTGWDPTKTMLYCYRSALPQTYPEPSLEAMVTR